MNRLSASSTILLKASPLLRCWSLRLKSSQTKFDWSYVCGPGSVPLVPLTLGQLVDRGAEKFGSREAVVSVHQQVRKSFSDVKVDVDKLAAGFVELGLTPGQRLGIWGPNSYEWYLTQFAAAKAGLILVNINPAYRPEELRYCLNKVGMTAVVSAETFKTQNYYEMLEQIIPELSNQDYGSTELQSKEVPTMKNLIMISDKNFRGATSFNQVFGSASDKSKDRILELERQIQSDDPVNIQFTSGTTGNPKGACLSHHGLVNDGRLVGYRFGYSKKAHRVCVPVPLYHCFGNVIGTMSLMYHGSTCVFPSYSFKALDAIQTVQDERCTAVYGTPTMFVDMLAVQREHKFDLSSLETGIMAGSPCPQELCKDVINELNMKDFCVAYGSTETSPVSFFSFPSDPPAVKTSTIGYPLDHIEAKVIDEQGKVVPTGTVGELCTRGFAVMLGYWDDDNKTAETITKAGWFLTGDQAVIDENGYGQIVGRIKDMVIRGGENIYPREIEELLHTHPDILEAQVVGVPDKRMGEELCAWIRVSGSGKSLTPEDIRDFSKNKISHFKIPRYIHFTQDFPVTVTGKIQKFKITEKSIELFKLQDQVH